MPPPSKELLKKLIQIVPSSKKVSNFIDEK
jgi:hypothetical protein